MIIIVKVIAGDLPKGTHRIGLKKVKSAELQTEENLKKLAGSAGWGFAGAVVGGLLTGGLGLAIGGLAGILSGGNKTEVCFSCELDDGRKFLAIADKKAWQKYLAFLFEKNHSSFAQTLTLSKPCLEDEVEFNSNQYKDKFEQHVADEASAMPESEVDEIQKLLQSALTEYNVLVQVNQTGKQLTIVVNRAINTLVEYTKLAEVVVNEINIASSNELSFNGIRQVKLIGRILRTSKPEWQKIYTFNTNNHEIRVQSPPITNKVTQVDYGEENHSKLKAEVYALLSRLWKWYISGFASRPELPLYEAPRFYRILLTIFVFLWVTAPFGLPDKIFSQETSTSSGSTMNSTVGPSLCVENFNQTMGGSASAEYIASTGKIHIMVHEKLSSESEVTTISKKFSNGIFSTCSLVDSIVFTFEGFYGTVEEHRP